MNSNYLTLNAMTWQQILRGDAGGYQPPYTVHLPIHPPETPDFVHVDTALNVCRRRVFPGLSIREWDAYQAMADLDTLIVQFAFDNPPFVPDFHLVKMHTPKGEYPLVRANYWHTDIFYEFEYMVAPVPGSGQNVLVVSGKLTNESIEAREVHMRAKVNIQRERDLFPYHYVPFNWDASNWLACDRVSLNENRIMLDDGLMGRVLQSDMKIEWESEGSFDSSQYNTRFGCGIPQTVSDAFMLKNTNNLIHFSKELQPGTSADFALAIFVDYDNVVDADRDYLSSLSLSGARRDSAAAFEALVPEPATQLTFPSAGWGKILEAVQISTLQLLVNFPGTTALMPTQGGSSERHLVWVWEAMCMLMPMLRLGYFSHVKRALEFIFGLQDSGYPPEGKFTSLEGAVGTTGPRWANTTGSALALAADYYRYSADEDFAAEYMPKMLRAADWILREIRATRVLNDDGSRPATYGIMPHACATDGDIGYIISFTDSYSHWGLEKFAKLLQGIGHERADEITKEAENYARDITLAAESVRRDDGFIERHIPVGEEKVYGKFNNIVGAAHLAFTDCIDYSSEIFAKYIKYYENNMSEELFLGNMDRDIAYMGLGEWVWHDLYLRLGEWKKAFAANRQNLLYGITRDTHQVQERFSRYNPAFTPWQPNGSGNGKVIETILKSIYFEHADRAILLGAVPFAYLVDNGETRLSNMRTVGGMLSVSVRSVEGGKLELELQNTGKMPKYLQIPSHFEVISCEGAQKTEDGLYSPQGAKVSFVLVEGSK